MDRGFELSEDIYCVTFLDNTVQKSFDLIVSGDSFNLLAIKPHNSLFVISESSLAELLFRHGSYGPFLGMPSGLADIIHGFLYRDPVATLDGGMFNVTFSKPSLFYEDFSILRETLDEASKTSDIKQPNIDINSKVVFPDAPDVRLLAGRYRD